jgi:energy-coupling factor transport system ATP-binding protein
MILAAIPFTIFIGVYYFGDRKYYFISALVLLEAILPFLMIFEKRKPQARELVVIAVLCGIAVAGRAAFFWAPQFKPVTALVMISAVAFGGEAGFLVGAMTALVSNMFFGQGPWTPWQMFAFGTIGFLTGILFRKGVLRSTKYALAIFGGLATFFIYGGIMNPASVLMFQGQPTKEMFFLAYLQGVPFDLVHASATVIFLLLAAEPMLEKLERIKIKYGLIEREKIKKEME